MSQPQGSAAEILIVGSGFAALQLVKSLRKLDGERPIRLLTADSGDDYNKPDLSHVISQGRSAAALTRQGGPAFAEQQRIALVPHCRVERIDRQARKVVTSSGEFAYGQLVLATGARALCPPIPGREHFITLNSQREYAASEAQLAAARRVLVLGAGLIGSELAMDLASAGREVVVVDLAHSPLASLMPAAVSQPLLEALRAQGVNLRMGCSVTALTAASRGLQVALSDGTLCEVDAAISAIGLRPNTALAAEAGLAVNRGIAVDSLLQSSDPHVFALGDCAEVDGQLRPYLQPILLGANALAKTLLGQPTALALPNMLVKVKTPLYPLQLAGQTQGEALNWQCEWNSRGLVARASDSAGRLCGFVVGGEQMKTAFALLRQLPARVASPIAVK